MTLVLKFADMTNLNRNQVLALLVWKATIGTGNWGGWGKYPSLPVGASYRQYATNQCQINLDKAVMVDGKGYNCITNGRPVGAKWDRPIGFGDLQAAFAISDEEIAHEIANNDNNERRTMVECWLDHARMMLINDDYKPFVCPIEQIWLRSERNGDNYTTEFVTVTFSHADSNEALTVAETIEWHQVRLQGKNGRNKKRVFVPVSLSEHTQQIIDSKLTELQAKRATDLKNQISKYEAELSTLK